MVHHNVQCLKNKIEEIEVFLATENIDILCVSESWVRSNEQKFINFPRYSIKSYFCREIFIHGGVLILVKNSLVSTEITDVVNLSIERIFECAAVKLTINNVSYCILCLYRAPNSDVNIFLSQLETCLNSLTNNNRYYKIIICGDININLFDKNKETIEFIDLVNSFCIESVFDEPTRISRSCSSAIDYILTNFNNNLVEKSICHTGLSDHSAQKIMFTVAKMNEQSYKFRSFSQKNIHYFTEYLKNETWQDVFIEQSTDNKYYVFNNILQYYYDLSFRFVTKNIGDGSNNKGWLTTGIKISSKHLKELFKLLNYGAVSNDYYKKYKAIYRRIVRQAKKNYFDSTILKSNNKSKTVWKIINASVGNNTNKNNINPIITADNVELTDKLKIANEFNSYFVNLPKSLINTIAANKSDSNNCFSVQRTVGNTIMLNAVSESEIINVINGLKNTNSSGCDNFSVRIIKQCSHLIAKPLCNIINQCFLEGHFPDLLKISKVICVYKKDNPKLICNYRPISLLSIFSKILEKVLATRIVSFLESNNILSHNQHGFRENQSTMSALLSFLNLIYKALDEGNKVIALFVDLSKAFDCVDHNILLKKMELYGLRGQCSKILKSYLSNRKQFVEYYGNRSDTLEIDIGVPQGSVLGPLLFLLYINDIENFIYIFYCAFADDISMVSYGKTVDDMTGKLNSNLLSLYDYFNITHLVMNLGKTFCMEFHPVGGNYTCSRLIKLNRKSIEQVKNFKLLGIHIDMSLDFKIHVEYICKKCASICFAIKRLCNVASKHIVQIFYHSNFESRIRYGVICWGNSSTANRVFVIQKRAIRFIFGLQYRQSCKETFIKRKIFTFPCLYIFEILKFVKKNISDFNLQNEYHQYNTRHGENLQYTLHRLELYKSNPYYMGAVLYNKLDSNIKNMTLKGFTAAVKNYLLRNAFYSVEEYLSA